LLAKLEPFALDLWREEIITWLPRHCADGVRKRLVFGGLYQLVVTYRWSRSTWSIAVSSPARYAGGCAVVGKTEPRGARRRSGFD